MAASYDVTKLAESDLYRVRYAIGDTDMADPMLQDEEIQFALDSKSNVQSAAVMCCETIVSRLAKKFDFKLGPSDNTVSQQYTHYKEVLQSLRGKNVQGPYFVNPHRSVFDIDMMNDASEHHDEEG